MSRQTCTICGKHLNHGAELGEGVCNRCRFPQPAFDSQKRELDRYKEGLVASEQQRKFLVYKCEQLQAEVERLEGGLQAILNSKETDDENVSSVLRKNW